MSGSGAMIAVLDNTDSVKSSYAVKVGLAQMLRGGVIMEVVNPEQARIAEEAGAVAIVATDVARGAELGMVMRMSDPVTIKEIKKAVTIPVMAKARVGHFVEAQVLEAIGVDFVDESEALTPADSANYINKHKFRIPFVCGCNNLGDTLRRIAEGAAMVRTRTEAFTNGSGGDVSDAVRHARAVVGEIRKLQSLDEDELYSLARQASAPLELARLTKQLGRLPVVNFAAGGVTTPADAALMMQLGCDGVFIGSHIFSGTNPSLRARSIVKAVAHYHDAQVLADVSSLNFGEPMHGVNLATNTTLG